MNIEVRLLGPFEVLSAGSLLSLPGNRLRVLVAVLAMSAGRPVSIDTIGAALWASKPPGNVQASVYTYVARLRHLLGDATISTGDGDYTLAIEPDAVDALRLLSLSDSGDISALDLWRGQPFTTLRSEWLEDTYGSPLTESYLGLLERRIDLDLDAGLAGDLVAELSTLVDRHPLRESLWARLLTALDRAGRPAEALDRYETVRRRFATELGAGPGPELRRIHAALLAADAAAGAGRMVDVPRQLPSDIERFTGRVHALAALDRPSGVAIVHGTAGVGKTALVVHWAHQMHDRFPDGQLFVNLRGYGPGPPVEPAAALGSLLRGLGVPGDQLPDDLAARGALLRRRLAGRRVLIVLDNARDWNQVRTLLPGPRSQVLITSRSRLRDPTAHEVALEHLTPDESVALLATTLRAGVDETALAELAELCGHLPLALIIAAEHAGRHPLSDIPELLRELRDRETRLDTLDIDDPAINPRAALSWSYQALDPLTARCFRLLGLHPGPDFSARSTAALIGTPEARATELLDRLTDGHLVRQAAPDRFEMHDLLRVYAAELCGDVESASAVARLYDWYLHSAANARRTAAVALMEIDIGEPMPGTAAVTFDDDAAALSWFDEERSTLVAVVRDAAARGHHRTVYRLTHMAHQYLTHRYLLDDVFTLQPLAVSSAERVGDMVAAAVSANQLGMTYGRRMQYEQAEAQFVRALELFEAARSDVWSAAVVGNLGTMLRMIGRPGEAVVRKRQAIDIFRRLGDTGGEANQLNNLCLAYLDLGEPDKAIAAARRAVELHSSGGKSYFEAIARDSLGQALAAAGRHGEAIDEYQRSLAIHQASGDRWNQSATLAHLGAAQHAVGLPDDARTSWQQALDIYDELGVSDTPELRRSDLVDLLGTVTPDQ